MDHAAHEGHAGHEGSPASSSRQLDTAELAGVLRSPNTFVIADMGTVRLARREIPVELSATGLITYDPRAARTVSARADGWIERLHVKYRFQRVERGAPLMDLNSRELLTAQENHLLLLAQTPRDQTLLDASARRLELLGLDRDQLAELERTRTPERTITYYSPIAGHLHENEQGEAVPADAMSGAGSTAAGLIVREGSFVEKGRTIFTINGTDPVLALINVHPDRQMWIREGQVVAVQVMGGDSVTGRVDLVEPAFREGGTFPTVRVYLRNAADHLIIGSRCTAIIHGDPVSLPVVPASAVVSTGMRSFVFVRQGDGFRSREVATGLRSGGWVEVRSGIGEGEDIARNAQLLIDSEAFLNSMRP